MSEKGKIQSLRDLGDVVVTTKANVRNFSRPAEFGISTGFAGALKAAFPDYSFEFYERTAKVATPGKQYIYVSGQAFALAVCLMDFCEEIGYYRSLAYRVLNRYREALEKFVPEQGRIDDKVFTSLRDNADKQLREAFKMKSMEFFNEGCDSKEIAETNTNLLMRFLTDYNWWLGGKQISRSNDWCISPISTLLNMPQNDSNFIARVVSKATEDSDFREAFKKAVEREWNAVNEADKTVSGVDNEKRFKCWLSTAIKPNGDTYSENTRSQYVSALKAAGTTFAEAIAPITSVFVISDVETLERAVAAIKADGKYDEFNRSRGNGSLGAGLDIYKRFLLEYKETSNLFTPEWFQQKAAEYPSLDDEANQLLTDFQAKFAPEYLASLSGEEMLNTIFLNAVNAENLCRVLEFGAQIKDTFGSIKGGNAYKYGLYYSTQGAWMTGSHQKPRQLTVEEAVEVGTKFRDHLVAGANAIKDYGELTSIEDYKKLHQILHTVTEGDIERVWFLKYYQMLYPEFFATNYSDYAQRTVLGAIGEEKERYPFVCMGQIRFYANKCGISNVMFNKIFWDYYSEEATVAKTEPSQDICYNTGYQSEYARNRILFGAPGTGKSFTLNQEKDKLLADGGEYERVTFHPDYSYANFVGTYKPVPCKDSDGKDAITYSYVPGPFMRTYVKALQNSRTDAPKPFLLVIEEINRANVAAVFGDVFQLLDRGDDEVSEYPIQASEDIKKYLAGELGGNPDDYAEIRIPDNMFIWATMNSADQGVFPMDTAFKRRWDFTYLGIDDSEAGIVGKKVILGQGEYRRIVEWNALRKSINDELLTYKVNEDKLMGPYFISKKNLPEGEMIDAAVFTRIFKNKVIMYLFDDAAKQKRITLFGGCDEKAKNQYSKICREFDTKGVYIFCEGISSQFIDNVPEDDGE